MKINLRSILIGVLLVLLLVGTVFFIKRSRPKEVRSPEPGAYHAPLKVEGPKNAPVKLVEYSDFECPSCRVAQDELRKILLDYPGKVQLTFKHYPLTSHKWSLYAHQAAECMNSQGKFWPYHDLLYRKQNDWAASNVPPVEILVRYAGETGANMDRFEKCMADVSVARAVYAEKEEGNQRQVNATPTLFLGDERFVGPKEIRMRGENAIRKVLGLPPNPVPEEKEGSPAPAFPAGIPKQKGS